MQIQDTTQPPPEIEKNVQISSKVSNETENEKHQSMNRLNIPDPLKIAVSNVENLSRSNSTDLDSRKKKKSSSKSVSSSKEIHDSPANQIETKHEREISKRSKTRSVDRKNSRKQKSLQETDIKSTSQNLSPSELRKMERKLSAVTDEQLLSENELKAIKKEKKRKKKSKEQQKTKEKIDDIPKESPTSPKDDLEVNNTDPTAKLYDSLGHPPEYFRNSTIKVHIHKSDTLKSNIYLKHPIVKVHFVDISTGMYLEKSDQMRQVTYFYEPESINFVLPTITNPFDLHANHTKNAKWDQKILLNESYLHILQPNVIVFFEVLNFLTNYSQILRYFICNLKK
jgi:jouberin